MKKICWFSWLLNPATRRRVAGGIGIALLAAVTSVAVAQTPTPEVQPPTAPKGYTVHETVNVGGRISTVNGSGAMYDTLVNEQSGPRVFGETFDMRALPGAKNTLFDNLTAVGSGFGGDPYSFAKMDFYKGNLYQFSGLFRRDRQYFDYDLLGNPNIPSGQTIPIGPTSAPTGSIPYSQVLDSPFLNDSVRRMTDTNLTLFPLSRVTIRAGYSHNTFEGPSLTPSGYQVASAYDVLLEEYQRNGTDDFLAGVDWKVLPETRLTLEEQIDHYKADSYFMMDPAYYNVQEPDGTPVALLVDYDSLTPYSGTSACNANSVGTTPVLSPAPPGGLPVINPACAVIRSYFRSQPTRFIFPTEIFRLQSSSLKNVSMNGDARYTNGKMNLPDYYENFQGLTKTTRSLTYNGDASAKRAVVAADYGIVWQATQKFSVSDQVDYSTEHQPGTASITNVTTLATPATAGNETINYAGGLTATNAAAGASTFEGSPTVGVPLAGYLGQKFITNNATATWDGWSRATLSLTYRYQTHTIAEGMFHTTPLAVGAVYSGTVTINENGGIFNAALRPTKDWDINGSAEMLYADNVFTPVAPRQLQHYRVHTLYRAKSWATISGAYNDMELHDNTNNNQSAVAAKDVAYAGPLDHVAHSRIASIGAQVNPNEHYGLDLNYSFSDVYTATNICYDAAASATQAGAMTPSGTACPGATVRGATYYEVGPVKDFIDAPTNSGSAAVRFAPTESVKWDVGYRINEVNGSRFYNDPRDVAGSLVSRYQSPFAKVAWTVRPGWIWKMEYQHYGYGEGGPSGAYYCSTSNPTPSTPASVSWCNAPALAGLQTGLTLPSSGETAPRTFRANNLTLGFRYEF